MRALVALTALALAAPASAQPQAQPPGSPDRSAEPAQPDAAEPRHTAASVVDQPAPGEASGVEVGPDRSGEWALWIPRVLLFPIRAAAELVGLPLRPAIRSYEVYDIGARLREIFFNEDGTVGLFPVLFAETDYGVNAGARLIVRDFAGDFEVSGRASFGGRFQQIYSLRLDSEDTWRRVRFDLGTRFEIRPRDQFWGIGNLDESTEAPAAPVDPLAGVARQTRFRQRAFRAVAGARYLPHRLVHTRVSAAFIDRAFEEPGDVDDGQRIEDTYDLAAIPGFERGSRHVYAELELGLDTRHAPTYWEGPATPSVGFLVSAFAGWAFAANDASSSYGRYGVDAQRFFRLGAGPRVLALRLYLEGITEDVADISFYDLPTLGGPLLLRGYELGRFRDRVAAVGSVEYQWDLSNRWLSGFVFADAGRTYRQLDDFTVDDARLGFGGGVELHTRGSYLGRLTLATSIDGGLLVSLGFDPVYDNRARVERR